MILIENVEVSGIEPAIRGMRNPMNSWAKSDSKTVYSGIDEQQRFEVGKADRSLMLSLTRSGTDHSKFLRMITVHADITAPFYWWKEFDTYRFGVEKNSCSTMHRIHKQDLSIEDFSTDGMTDFAKAELESVIRTLNGLRQRFMESESKEHWRSMIQLLPSCYNQRRTVMCSYQALRNMYHARKHHKLTEWRQLCGWIETLPLHDLFTFDFESELEYAYENDL